MAIQYIKVTQDAVKEAEASQSSKLLVPPTAKLNRKDPEDARWRERIKIVEVSAEELESKAGDDHIQFTVRGEITEEGSSGSNVGRTVTSRMRINPAAYAAGDKKDGQYKMSRGTIARLTELFRAVGYYEDGDLEAAFFDQMFPAEDSGETSPLLDQEVEIEVHQSPSDEAPSGYNTEITRFLVPETSDAMSLSGQ